MSDMISRLRAVSDEAGKDAAANLHDRAARAAMESRVRSGVRRRRIRGTAASLTVIAALGVGAVVVPNLLEHAQLPPAGPGARTVLRTDGAITTFSDGSMSVVLDSGRLLDVVPVQDDLAGVRTISLKEGCALASDTLGPRGLDTAANQYLSLVTFGSAVKLDEAGDTAPLFAALPISFPDGAEPRIAFQLQADRAVAPNLVIVLSVAEVRNGEVVFFGSRLSSSPIVQFQGDAGAGTQGAVVTSRAFNLRDLSYCTDDLDVDAFKDVGLGKHEFYVIANVWLTDRSGAAAKIGTYTEVYQFDGDVS